MSLQFSVDQTAVTQSSLKKNPERLSEKKRGRIGFKKLLKAPKCNYGLFPDINLICFKTSLPLLQPVEAWPRIKHFRVTLFMSTSGT